MADNKTSLAASVEKALDKICRAKGCIEDHRSFGDGDLRKAEALLGVAQADLEAALHDK